MKTSLAKYKGGLRTEITHIKSNTNYLTDAPTDNNGLGSTFSPTDLVATSLASCMLTMIGIYCSKNNLKFENGEASIVKTMASEPRRIAKIEIELDLSGNGFSDKDQIKLTGIAKNCPVAKSLSSEIIQDLKVVF